MKVALIVFVTMALAAQTKRAPVYVQDGGTRQTLESIFIPPMVDAPFTFTLHTEWVQNLPDGGTLTLVNQRRIARQSSGRFYQERWLLVPKNGQVQSLLSHIQIADPNDHVLHTCAFGPNVCSVLSYGGATTASYMPAHVASGPLPNGEGSVTVDSFGGDITLGIETQHTRITRTINPGVIGNDRPIVTTREFWFAPSLGVNLVSKVSDPRFGTQTFTVTDLKLGEPDPALFNLPEGFKVQDQRVQQHTQ